jgi:predicted RNA-binding Zn-ribbon protein involved in translation (DUF1610 family)
MNKEKEALKRLKTVMSGDDACGFYRQFTSSAEAYHKDLALLEPLVEKNIAKALITERAESNKAYVSFVDKCPNCGVVHNRCMRMRRDNKLIWLKAVDDEEWFCPYCGQRIKGSGK